MYKNKIQNQELLTNCSTNLTEFYNSYDMDRNSRWNLKIIDNSSSIGSNYFFLQFNPFENVTENYNLNYIPVHTYNEKRENLFGFNPRPKIKAKIEKLDKLNNLKYNFGYRANVKVLAELAYPFKIIKEIYKKSIFEAFSDIGGFLKFISFLRYLYIFGEYDYDKFHFDLLKKVFEYKKQEKFKQNQREALKNFINKNRKQITHLSPLEIQAVDQISDEKYKNKNSIKNETKKDIISKYENNEICIKEKCEESKYKPGYNLNELENDRFIQLIPPYLKQKHNINQEFIDDFDNLSFWDWFRMKISCFRRCRNFEKKKKFY